ncbi:MAG: hypothetical protein BGO47_06895 [Microbacterium sp. 67-17]|nr:MAG: hypothetical protein BGO47_06895 [Microbacterium sp. 67-17]
MGLVSVVADAASVVAPVPVLPNLVLGVAAIVIGILVIVFRRALHGVISRGQRELVGRRVSGGLERFQSAFWVGFSGACAIGMGVVMIAFGLTAFLAEAA